MSQRINQNSVIGHMRVVGVRPVRSPDAAIRISGDQVSCERNTFPVGWLSIDAINAAHLNHKAWLLQQVTQVLEVFVLESQLGINPAHMIHDDSDGRLLQ